MGPIPSQGRNRDRPGLGRGGRRDLGTRPFRRDRHASTSFKLKLKLSGSPVGERYFISP